jgi:hypothetical protein
MIALLGYNVSGYAPCDSGRAIKIAQRDAILFFLNQRTFALSVLFAERVALVESK